MKYTIVEEDHEEKDKHASNLYLVWYEKGNFFSSSLEMFPSGISKSMLKVHSAPKMLTYITQYFSWILKLFIMIHKQLFIVKNDIRDVLQNIYTCL
jgi:hypothetical protein